MKTISERIQLHIPPGKLAAFCEKNGYGNYQTMKAVHKKEACPWKRDSFEDRLLPIRRGGKNTSFVS
jgi:hypothetical protein